MPFDRKSAVQVFFESGPMIKKNREYYDKTISGRLLKHSNHQYNVKKKEKKKRFFRIVFRKVALLLS